MNPDSGQRVALVTGSGRGIGREIALRLAGGCSAVAVHYLTGREKAEETAEAVRSLGTAAAAFRADLTVESEVRSLIEAVGKRFGGPDILVNNVGPLLVKSWSDVTSGEWDRVFAANFKTALHALQAALPGMRERNWGRIINIGFSRVEEPAAFLEITPYAAAKSALLLLTRAAARTEAGRGITVNMVSPGLMKDGALPADRRVPAGRLGRPADVAAAAAYLVSDEAEYVTGVNLIVAGGWKL